MKTPTTETGIEFTGCCCSRGFDFTLDFVRGEAEFFAEVDVQIDRNGPFEAVDSVTVREVRCWWQWAPSADELSAWIKANSDAVYAAVDDALNDRVRGGGW